jgi:hypothetical protein
MQQSATFGEGLEGGKLVPWPFEASEGGVEMRIFSENFSG